MSDLQLDPMQGILSILEYGNTTGTNKYGLLLSLIDLAPLVGEDRTIKVQEIALKLIEIHWTHVTPFMGTKPLRQVSSSNRENTAIVLELQKLKSQVQQNCRYERARTTIPATKWNVALQKIGWQTLKNPIRKLQTLPGNPTPFLYEINENRSSITLFENALRDLIRFGPVIRELVEYRFVHYVIKINPSIGQTTEDKVHTHLFNRDREMPNLEIRKRLWDLQGGRCIYTNEEIENPELRRGRTAIDHVVPWSAARLSQIENFAVTSTKTNSVKSNVLLAPTLLNKWSNFMKGNWTPIKELSATSNWPSDLRQLCDVSISLYFHMSESDPVWDGKEGYSPIGQIGKNQAIDCLRNLALLE